MKNGKIQIKEIANHLGLSPSTISLVLGGKGEAMGISKATQQRVKDAAKEMNYQPNMAARRVRSAINEEVAKVIAVFWCADFSDITMGRFFKGLYDTVNEKKYTIDFMIHFFDVNRLSGHKDLMTASRFSGIIIVGTSDQDIQFLNENTFDLPIVLMNRNEERYNCVYVNDYEIGNSSGRLFHSRSHKKVGLITIQRKSHSVSLRQLGFVDACRKYEMELRKEWIEEADGRDFAEGYEATRKVLTGENRPTALFVMAPGQVLGTVQACKDAGLSIPKDIEILTYGDNDILPYYSPSISTVNIPIETTAENALNLLILVIDHDIQMPMSRMLLAEYKFRESCGEFIDRV